MREGFKRAIPKSEGEIWWGDPLVLHASADEQVPERNAWT
jgi:hypothetical protein